MDNREKLDIVFELEPIRINQMAGNQQISKPLDFSGLSDIRALQLVLDAMRKLYGIREFYENGNKISAESCLRQVEHQGKWSRPIDAGGLSFRFGHVSALKHTFISIQEIEAGAAKSWNDLIEPFLGEDGFVQAWISNVEYDYWQNAKDPIQYQAVGRSYSHLPTRSNGLPPPLEKLEIDISKNPGRWSLKVGYIEAIGSTMWLGQPFWQYVGESRKNDVRSSGWIDVKQLAHGVTQLVAADRSFHDETTADVQNRLRFILYGT